MTDPIDRFRAMSPFIHEPVVHEPADTQLDERDAALLRRIMQQPIERDSTAGESSVVEIDAARVERASGGVSRPRRPVWLVTAAIAATAIATAAFAVLRTERATVPNAVACHATADTQSDIVGLGGSADPIAACSEVWARGDFGGDGTVPLLAACVNSGGAAAVFPGDAEVCDRLGLAQLEAGFTDEQQAVLDLEDRLVTVFMETCFDQEAAVAEAERQLELLGLTDWTARVAEDFPDGMPCASPGVLPVERIVIVVGVPAG